MNTDAKTVTPTRPRSLRAVCLAAALAISTMVASAATQLLNFEFDEGTVNRVTDDINGLTGTPSANQPTIVTDAPSGQPGNKAIHFEDGQNITVSDPDTVMQLDEADPSFTLQAWVKFSGLPATRMVFFYNNGPGGAISFSVNIDRTVFVTTLGILDAGSAAAIPDDGAWHHIAVVHQNGVELRYYVDGVLADTRAYTSGVIFTRTQDYFTLGAEPGGGLPFVGSVDRLKITSGVLSEAELDSDPSVAFLDSDSDGMPDAWEITYGFDINDPADAAEDCNGDGQTNLEACIANTDPCDATPPTITYAAGSSTFDQVTVWFSEPLDPTTAQATANYGLSGGVTISAATQVSPGVVLLTTSAQAENTALTLTVNNVGDLNGNVIAADSTRDFTTHVWTPGVILHKYWAGVSSATIAGLTNDVRYPNSPSMMTLEPRWEYPPDGGNEGGSNYGNMLEGWFTAPQTGNYVFFTCSDDPSTLYLSTDEDPANVKIICAETGWSNPRSWVSAAVGDPETKRSDGNFTPPLGSESVEDWYPTVEIPLTAGERRYMMALHAEGGGGDNLGGTYKLESEADPVDGSEPRLTASLFGAYLDPNVELDFSQQPTDQVGTLPSAGVEVVAIDFDGNDGGFTVVNTDPAPPGPWGYDSASGKWVANGGESDCTGPYNSQLSSPGFTMTQDGSVSVSFDHRYSFEGDLWDGGAIRISVNGGEFTLVPAENFTANGYAEGTIQGSGILNGQRGFNGDSPGYASETFITSKASLGAFSAGDVVVVQFVGAWDECTTGSEPGWVIDSFKLELLPMILQDFANGDGGFTVENDPATPPANWGPFVYDAVEGQWAANGADTECGGPFNSNLTSPAYTVPQTDPVTLTFSHRYRFEGDLWDGGQVRISINGGEFTPVSAENFTANGYAAGNIIGNGILNGQRAFNGDSAGFDNGDFIQSSAVLGTFSQGDTVAVQFVGGWDDCWSPGQPGWVIKDLQLAFGKAAEPVSFTGEAVGNSGGTTTVSYQWQRDDGTGFVDIAGANTSTLRFYPVAADFDASFQLVASVLNKSITSDVVKLLTGSVEPPQLSVAWSNGAIVLTFDGTLESAPDAAGPYTAVEGAQSPYEVQDATGAAFYRSMR